MAEELDVAMKVEIPIRDATGRIYFTQGVGTARYGGEEMDVSQVIAGGSLLFGFRGKTYMVDTQDLINAIWAEALVGQIA